MHEDLLARGFQQFGHGFHMLWVRLIRGQCFLVHKADDDADVKAAIYNGAWTWQGFAGGQGEDARDIAEAVSGLDDLGAGCGVTFLVQPDEHHMLYRWI